MYFKQKLIISNFIVNILKSKLSQSAVRKNLNFKVFFPAQKMSFWLKGEGAGWDR